MKTFTIPVALLFAGFSAFGGPCLPGTLQDYVNLGSSGCQLSNTLIFNFELAPVLSGATPIDPSGIQVTPGGGPAAASLLFTLNSTAGPGEIFESFFRFNATGD